MAKLLSLIKLLRLSRLVRYVSQFEEIYVRWKLRPYFVYSVKLIGYHVVQLLKATNVVIYYPIEAM